MQSIHKQCHSQPQIYKSTRCANSHLIHTSTPVHSHTSRFSYWLLRPSPRKPFLSRSIAISHFTIGVSCASRTHVQCIVPICIYTYLHVAFNTHCEIKRARKFLPPTGRLRYWSKWVERGEGQSDGGYYFAMVRFRLVYYWKYYSKCQGFVL